MHKAANNQDTHHSRLQTLHWSAEPELGHDGTQNQVVIPPLQRQQAKEHASQEPQLYDSVDRANA